MRTPEGSLPREAIAARTSCDDAAQVAPLHVGEDVDDFLHVDVRDLAHVHGGLGGAQISEGLRGRLGLDGKLRAFLLA